MNIALFHNAPSGGAKRAIFEWTRLLGQRHSIDVYTLSTANHEFCDIRSLVKHHFIYTFAPRRLFDSPWGRLNQLQRWRDLAALTDIERDIACTINAEGYDVAFVHTCQFTVIPILIQYLDVPSVYYLHEAVGISSAANLGRPYLQSEAWREHLDRIDPLIELYASQLKSTQEASIRAADRLLANSNFTCKQMQDQYGIATPISHYGVDHRAFKPEPGIEKEDFVLSVGEMSPRKGFDFLIESLGHIPPSERPKLKLACNAIQESEYRFVQNLASEYQVQLEVLSNQNVQQLNQLYNRARLCIYAPVAEPFGLVPLEAMSCGTPVIGVNEGGVRESVVHDHTGLLVERQPDSFAMATQQLLTNPRMAERYGQNGRKHVLQHWTWEQSTQALEKHLTASAQSI